MKRVVCVALAIASTAVTLTATASTADDLADGPARRVVAIYFHRTQRCPTCLKMGSYSEEAVKQGFAEQVKQGAVSFHYVDFQDPNNAVLAKAYKISGPALIVAMVLEDKTKEFKDLKDIWINVGEKPKFIKYVQEHVEAYLTEGMAHRAKPR